MEWKKQEILSSKMITKSRNWEEDIDGSYNQSPITASVGSGEPFIGLKLGKRTYFEAKNNNSKTSSSSSFSCSTTKKAKLGCQSTPVPRCQVEGCNLDLSSSKEYHRKHRVCETHSKYPKVVVSGVERRFCQQCSRFHNLSEFDEKKRSCRRRLSDHNARRRKLQHDFNSTNLTSSFYVNMKADKSSLVLDGSVSLSPNMPTIAFNTSKHTRVEVLDQGLKESFSPNVDALRALSLLSNNYSYNYNYSYNSYGYNSTCLTDPDLIALDHHHPMHHHADNPTTIIQQEMQSVHQLSFPDFSQTDIHSKADNTPFHEFQLFNRFYSNPNPVDDF